MAMPVTSTVTLLFCDLVSSTERQSRLGDDAADEFLRRMFAVMRHTAEQTHGEVIKMLGDGMMMVFRASTIDALTCAMALHENVASLDPLDPPLLRIGISAGEVSHAEGDLFGMPVIEAARLCAAASAGQSLATDVVRALVGTRGRYELAPIGDLSLKGIPEPVTTVEIRRLSAGAPDPRVSGQPPTSPVSNESPPPTDIRPTPTTVTEPVGDVRPPPLGPPLIPPQPTQPAVAGQPPSPAPPSISGAPAGPAAPPTGRPRRTGLLVVGGLVAAGALVAAGMAIGGRSATDVADSSTPEAPRSTAAIEPPVSADSEPPAAPTDESIAASEATVPTAPATPGQRRTVPRPEVSVASDRTAAVSADDIIADVTFTPNLLNYVVTFELPEATAFGVYWSSIAELRTVPVTVTLIPPTGDALQIDILDFGYFDAQVALGGEYQVLVEVPEGTLGAGTVQLSVLS
jgi:class 3 adenylate cyclase